MKVLRVLSCLLLVLLLAPLTEAGAQTRDPWEKRPTCIFGMPYTGHAVKKDGTGSLQIMLREIYESADIVFEYQQMPYSRVSEALAKGSIDCTVTIKERNLGGTLGDFSLGYYALSAACLKDTPWQGVQSLKDARVAFQHGYELEELIPVPFVTQMLYDSATAFHMLDSGLILYVLDDERLLKAAMLDSNLPSHLFAIHPIKTLEVRPTFAKTPSGEKCREIFNRRMRELIRSGEAAQLYLDAGVPPETVTRLFGK